MSFCTSNLLLWSPRGTKAYVLDSHRFFISVSSFWHLLDSSQLSFRVWWSCMALTLLGCGIHFTLYLHNKRYTFPWWMKPSKKWSETDRSWMLLYWNHYKCQSCIISTCFLTFWLYLAKQLESDILHEVNIYFSKRFYGKIMLDRMARQQPFLETKSICY